MSTGLFSDISLFVLALLVGVEVISKVPATLHTPLMSASNAIHGIVFVGVMVTAAEAHSIVGHILAFVAAAFASMNVVGGYALTDRMLQMFRRRPAPPANASRPASSPASNGPASSRPAGPSPAGTASAGPANNGHGPNGPSRGPGAGVGRR